MALPENPAAWYQLAAIGGWQAVVADTVHPLAHDLLAARCAGETGQTRGWYDLPYAVPVLCAAATAQGVRGLQQAVMALHAEGLPLQRTVVALISTGDGRPPVAVRAGATMLTSRTAAVVQVPYDPHIRAHSLAAARLRSRTRQAAAQLTGAVLAAAHATWGHPLPDAPQPAPVTPAVTAS
ncbi:CobQ/CobB/MinD/ParA nucleotide binding domain-containing protein OS=Streptomyces griseomycini OX=66895 GN=FHS37_007126 PE=4 SV=1 [Streptomyces griseomycini]